MGLRKGLKLRGKSNCKGVKRPGVEVKGATGNATHYILKDHKILFRLILLVKCPLTSFLIHLKLKSV